MTDTDSKYTTKEPSVKRAGPLPELARFRDFLQRYRFAALLASLGANRDAQSALLRGLASDGNTAKGKNAKATPPKLLWFAQEPAALAGLQGQKALPAVLARIAWPGKPGAPAQPKIAPLNAARLERIGEAAYLGMQLPIRQRSYVARFTLEHDRGLVAARREVAVEAVFGDVELAAGEPLRVRRVPFQRLFERLAPDEMLLGLTGPELFWAIDRLGVELLVQSLAPKICLGFELGRRPELPGFPGN